MPLASSGPSNSRSRSIPLYPCSVHRHGTLAWTSAIQPAPIAPTLRRLSPGDRSPHPPPPSLHPPLPSLGHPCAIPAPPPEEAEGRWMCGPSRVPLVIKKLPFGHECSTTKIRAATAVEQRQPSRSGWSPLCMCDSLAGADGAAAAVEQRRWQRKSRGSEMRTRKKTRQS